MPEIVRGRRHYDVSMATIEADGDALVVRLQRGEKVLGMLGDLRVPLSSIVAVEAVPDGRAAVHGRRTGLGGPQRLIGTWRTDGDGQYVCVRRDQPAVKVTLEGERYRTVVIGTDDAAEWAASIDRARRTSRGT
jgi:hypothetical protein